MPGNMIIPTINKFAVYEHWSKEIGADAIWINTQHYGVPE